MGIGRCWVCSKCNIFIQVTDGIIRKTQIALQYAYSVENKCSVFWVHSDSYTRFSRDYREIANRAQLPKNPVAEEELLFEIRKWLESPTSGPWVMILDNADNLLEMFPPVSEDKKPVGLSKFLPQGSKGTILITTRDRVVASRLANMDMLEVKAMGPREAGTLFLRYAPDAISSEEDKAVFPRLLDTLKFLPLAIVGAAAFMRENGVSSTEYFELYSKGKQARSELLSCEFNDFRRGSEVPEAVLTTYFTLFERLQIQSPMAADFLRLIAFFDRNGIQKELLMSSGLEGVDNPVRFTKAIGKLLSFSLMTKSVDGQMYQVHRLVHMSIEAFFPDEDGKWKSRALDILLGQFLVHSDIRLTFESEFGVYLPHVLAIIKVCSDAPTPAVVTLSGRVGRYLYALGNIDDGEYHLRNCISMHSSSEKLRSDEALFAILALGRIFETRQRFQEVTELYFALVEDYEGLLKSSGEGHHFIGTIIDRLLKVYSIQLNFSPARLQPLCRRMLEYRVELFGSYHQDVIPSIHALAKVHSFQKHHDIAADLYKWAAERAKQCLGSENPNTLHCLIELALEEKLENEYKNVENTLDEAVKVSEKIRTENLFVVRCFVKLALALHKQNKSGQAEAILQRALEMSETLHKRGDSSRDIWDSLIEIGQHYGYIDKHEEASRIYSLAIARLEQVLGASHVATLDTLWELGSSLMAQEKYPEAEAAYLRAYKGFENKYGPNNPFTIKCATYLGILHGFQGRHADAKLVCERAFEGYKTAYGAEHKQTLKMHAFMDNCLSAQKAEGKPTGDIVQQAMLDAVLRFVTPPVPPRDQLKGHAREGGSSYWLLLHPMVMEDVD